MTTLASLVSTLADLFRKAFVAERGQPHRPLKIGVDADLIATSILTPSEVRSALRSYTSRGMYLTATAVSGVRFDLDSHPADEVTAQPAEWLGETRPYGCAPCPGGLGGGRGPRTDRGPQSREGGRREMPSLACILSQARREKTRVCPSSGVHRHSLADLRIAAARDQRCDGMSLLKKPQGKTATSSAHSEVMMGRADASA
jgi:hypothetical protein